MVNSRRLVSHFGILSALPYKINLLRRHSYTSMSLPFHIGVGWLGGFLPTVPCSLVAITGNIYSGLWYLVVIALLSGCIGAYFLPDARGDRRET
jgi:hypothetical protein